MCIAAFPYGAGHFPLLWRTQRMACMDGGYIQLQCKAALEKADVLRRKGEQADAPIRCQTIFFPPVQDGTDTTEKDSTVKGNAGNGNHKGAGLRKIIALHPQIRTRKRSPTICFRIPQSSVKVVLTSVYRNAALQLMCHTENPMAALHREKAERAHNMGAKGCKGAVWNLTADAGQLNMAPSPGKTAFIRLNHAVLHGKPG